MMLAERIKNFRMENGLTQRELAEALNSSQNAISNYENGVRTPTVKKLFAIAALLGCNVADLMTDMETTASVKAQPQQGDGSTSA